MLLAARCQTRHPLTRDGAFCRIHQCRANVERHGVGAAGPAQAPGKGGCSCAWEAVWAWQGVAGRLHRRQQPNRDPSNNADACRLVGRRSGPGGLRGRVGAGRPARRGEQGGDQILPFVFVAFDCRKNKSFPAFSVEIRERRGSPHWLSAGYCSRARRVRRRCALKIERNLRVPRCVRVGAEASVAHCAKLCCCYRRSLFVRKRSHGATARTPL